MEPNYRLKDRAVIATQHKGAMLTVINDHRGEQHAREGDWLVRPKDAKRGEVEVLTTDEFNRIYEPITPTEPIAEAKAHRKAKEQ